MTALDRPSLERFRVAVSERLGFHFDDDKLELLGEVLQQRVAQRGERSIEAYLQALGAPGEASEVRALAELLTVGETYFFRNADHFRAFVDVVIPQHAAGRPLRVLSAGSSSGEEARTVAMLLHEHAPAVDAALRPILGIDVNPLAIEKARRGIYSAWSLRDTPADYQRRYFKTVGRELHLTDEIRAMVTFEERNLIAPNALFWQPGRFDVVFCRNVVMYFHRDIARAVIERIATSLVPGGHLFLGHAETMRGMSSAFHLCHTHGTFYYQKKTDAELGDVVGRAHAAVPSAPFAAMRAPALPAPLPSQDTSWSQAIESASQRIEMLARDSSRVGRDGDEGQRTASAAPAVDASTQRQRMQALELLRQERHVEALALIDGATAQGDPELQLLRAALLTNAGDVVAAERACQGILADDEMNAGAHYLMALCREHQGDFAGAADHDQSAAYLDPSFAMSRLHLGLLAKRKGDVETVRRELHEALGLLAREDPARVLLFGGGFTRETLAALCKAELRNAGGAP